MTRSKTLKPCKDFLRPATPSMWSNRMAKSRRGDVVVRLDSKCSESVAGAPQKTARPVSGRAKSPVFFVKAPGAPVFHPAFAGLSLGTGPRAAERRKAHPLQSVRARHRARAPLGAPPRCFSGAGP